MSKSAWFEVIRVTWPYGITAGIFLLFAAVAVGPNGIKTGCAGWQASAYGSDWIVVQYAQSGCVLSSWELKDEAIKNESGSDGIFFVGEEGDVVHLSGHYIYVQDPTEKTKAGLLRTGYCPGSMNP
jgi:hypothetical protein